MEERTFETPYGPIVLWGEAGAFSSQRPLVVALAGAFAIAKGPLFHMAPALAPLADVVTGHLPGNHCPTLISASVGIYASAYSHVIAEAFGGRPVVACGASIGGLVALGLCAPQIRRALVVEPPLVMSKVWPMWPTLRHKLAQSPQDPDVRAFIVNVFGVTETAIAERRYDTLLPAVSVPTHVLVGDRPLFPERPVEKLPSLVDDPERALLAAHPKIRVTEAAGAGHNVLQEAAPVFLGALRAAIQDATD
jgi:pimeloyl-ACP methyl ester carboxylesterase